MAPEVFSNSIILLLYDSFWSSNVYLTADQLQQGQFNHQSALSHVHFVLALLGARGATKNHARTACGTKNLFLTARPF